MDIHRLILQAKWDMKKYCTGIILFALLLLTACHSGENRKKNMGLDINYYINCDTLVINCDSIYPEKNFILTLTRCDNPDSDVNLRNNTSLKITRGNEELLTDRIMCAYLHVEFHDFNGDRVKDILVVNGTGARANTMYFLYIFDKQNDKFKRIKGFENIFNPTYIPDYNMIESYVLSGVNYICYYKIQGDSIFNPDLCVNDYLTDEDNEKSRQNERLIEETRTQAIKIFSSLSNR